MVQIFYFLATKKKKKSPNCLERVTSYSASGLKFSSFYNPMPFVFNIIAFLTFPDLKLEKISITFFLMAVNRMS